MKLWRLHADCKSPLDNPDISYYRTSTMYAPTELQAKHKYFDYLADLGYEVTELRAEFLEER